MPPRVEVDAVLVGLVRLLRLLRVPRLLGLLRLEVRDFDVRVLTDFVFVGDFVIEVTVMLFGTIVVKLVSG